MNRLLILIALFPSFASAQTQANERLLQRLDSAISERRTITHNKERELEKLKYQISSASTNEDLLDKLDLVYKEYLTYRYDSALVYIKRYISLAKECHNDTCYQKAMISHALLDARGGLYSEAADYLKGIDPEKLSLSLRYEYHNACYWLYMNWREYISDEEEKDSMFGLMEQNLKDAIECTEKESANYHYLKGEHLFIFQHKTDEAILSYQQAVNLSPVKSKVYASATYALAGCYLKKNDTENYEKWVIMSAISDMLTPLKENFALQELAMYLFEKDNSYVERATNYIYCSMEDAQFYNDRPHIIKISQKFPVILSAYTGRIKHQKSFILYGMIALGILSITILASALYIKRQNGQLHRRRKELQAKNEELHQQHEQVKQKNTQLEEQGRQLSVLNEQQAQMNTQLQELNERLVYTNKHRESLASIYIDLCAKYIDKLKKYQILVKRKIKANQVQELLSTISSSRISEEDAATFLTRFDKAFLDLYPTFVSELNTLLVPESQIAIKHPNALTPELRIYALIRLGVKESSEIADLLFFSPQTIYNYRSALKAKAINKETFDDDVMYLCTVIK